MLEIVGRLGVPFCVLERSGDDLEPMVDHHGSIGEEKWLDIRKSIETSCVCAFLIKVPNEALGSYLCYFWGHIGSQGGLGDFLNVLWRLGILKSAWEYLASRVSVGEQDRDLRQLTQETVTVCFGGPLGI
jgi:hypothetical protein